MAKARKSSKNGEPLPEYFHPKDTPNGLIWRCGGIGITPDVRRGTVHIAVGGATAEMTIEAAQAFEQQLKCAINCACEKPATGKKGDL